MPSKSESSPSMKHNHGDCKSTMFWNWYTIDACFFSPFWKIKSAASFAGLCIGLISLVIFLEFLRRVQRELQRLNRVNVDHEDKWENSEGMKWEETGPDGKEMEQVGGKHHQMGHDNHREDDHHQYHGHHHHNQQRTFQQQTIPKQPPVYIETGPSPNRSRPPSFEETASTTIDASTLVPPSTPLLLTSSTQHDRPNDRLCRLWGRTPNKLTRHVASSVIYTCEFTVAYLLMLMAMYYNGYIITCIIVGALLGRLIWGWDLVSSDGGHRRKATGPGTLSNERQQQPCAAGCA